jgi:methionyl-tRNA formyltransferase
MILRGIGMVAVANVRSHAYLDAMRGADLMPEVVLLLEKTAAPGSGAGEKKAGFLEMLSALKIPFVELGKGDINDPEVADAVAKRPEHTFIYSGPGGAILRKPVITCGKKFLHVHPGRLPGFRGSTTVYYHLLSGDTCTATAIFLEEKIDQGPILAEREFPFPLGAPCDLDYDFDPRIRASVLVSVLEFYAKNGDFPELRRQESGGETWYIMHPVLRHIARLRLERNAPGRGGR